MTDVIVRDFSQTSSAISTCYLCCRALESKKRTKRTRKKKKKKVEENSIVPEMLCDYNYKIATNAVIISSSSRIITIILSAVVFTLLCQASGVHSEPAGASSLTSGTLNEYQLIGQANQEAHLPCLIGRQLHCGEPYFIAWYKLNSSSKSWVRIEHKSEEELAGSGQSSSSSSSSSSLGSNFNERVRFTWSRSASGAQRASARSACDQQLLYLANQPISGQSLRSAANFDCAQLTISPLELIDEGQYKCEITFSESLDFDKCPATTLSQLNVIARPNEPEVLVNGRPVVGKLLTFKEGAQVRLECQSSGGKPAPRIEWLNVSSAPLLSATTIYDDDNNNNNNLDQRGQQQAEPLVQLMRVHWPQKKATYSVDNNNNGTLLPYNQYLQSAATPITSSSVTISLTRYDLQSQFVCLLIPQQSYHQHASNVVAPQSHEQLIKSPAYLTRLLNQRPAASRAGSVSGSIVASGDGSAPMLKWIKLDVQVKPSSVSVIVKDIEANSTLQPVLMGQQQSGRQQQPFAGLIEHQMMGPFYSLQPNRLYAIQCVVENSRPYSQVAWFNRTAPIGVGVNQLNSTDYLVPNEANIRRHKLSSFSRSIGHANGTFRTTASLLLTTSVWDNFEELFCRISNEAFQFDELVQVAPIISARLYVNYPPLAWLEVVADTTGAKWTTKPTEQTEQQQQQPTTNRLLSWSGVSRIIRPDQHSELTLRCSVAANPLSQNTILQIEWLKDGRKLQQSAASTTSSRQQAQQQQQQQQRIQIEKANHLHMPMSVLADATKYKQLPGQQSGGGASPLGNQLVASSKLIASSSLTINSLAKTDSGAYSCQYKLIPAPSVQAGGSQSAAASATNSQQQIRITSGQANQTIQVNVIEAKPKAPVLKILSSKSLLIYGLQAPPDGAGGKHQHRKLTATIADLDALVSLKCDLPSIQQPTIEQVGHKVLWYLNGNYLHSSGTLDTYNFTLSSFAEHSKHLGSISCAHHILGTSMSTSDNFHGNLVKIYQSINEIDIKVKVGPQMLERRELMPPVRSFSELELNANSANKLRLVCLAQCEPICSIDWYLDEQPLSATAAAASSKRQQQLAASGASSSTPGGSSLIMASTADGAIKSSDDAPMMTTTTTTNQTFTSAGGTTTLASRRLREFDGATDTGSEMAATSMERLRLTLGTMIEVENVIRRQNESKFSWLKETSLSASSSSSGQQNQAPSTTAETLLSPSLELDSKQLMREAEQAHHLIGANVFSKLELTYNQIGQLLARGPNEEILVKCKLNSMLNGAAASSGSSGGSRLMTTDQKTNGRPFSLSVNNNNAAFGYALVEPLRWFPSYKEDNNNEEDDDDGTANSGVGGQDFETDHRYQFAMSNEPLNLTALYHNNNNKEPEIDNESRQLQTSSSLSLWNDLHSRRLLSSSTSLDRASEAWKPAKVTTSTSGGLPSFVDEMQISILLDKPPKSVSISLTNIVGTHNDGGIALSDSQLLELADPNKAAPLLQCTVLGVPYPAVQFKWTFTDLNRTEHSVLNDGPQMNLRQFIEFRQRQLNVDPMSAYGVDVVASIVGNYTCTAANVHGSRSATLAFQIQGRPLCKLTLEGEYLSVDNELMANLRCSIYSLPSLLETVWFRNSQQLSVNKSSSTNVPLSFVQLPIMVLNKQQDFMMTDLITQPLANFRCIARNQFGYSEACDLNQIDKQTLLNTLKPIGGIGLGGKSPVLPVLSYSDGAKQQQGTSMNFIANVSTDSIGSPSSVGHHQPTGAVMNSLIVRNLFARLDLLLIFACCLAFAWLLFVVGPSLVRRRFGALRGGSAKSDLRKANHNTSWRFNSAHHRANSNSEIVGVPFQSKICVNYYGGSNGDSEHDMMQSHGSQSSHYEDFAQHQHQLQQHQQSIVQQQQMLLNQQQPVYFNGHSSSTTLSRRPLKSSLSCSSSTGEGGSSNITGGGGLQHQLVATNTRQHPHLNHDTAARVAQMGTMREFTGSASTHKQYNQTTNLAATMRESLANGGRHHSGGAINEGLTLTSNVPLVNGTHNSRIQLDQQQQSAQPRQQQHQRFNRDQQTFSSQLRNEHIYDDVIYNQIIL